MKNVQMIDVDDWDDLVTETYGRPYCFQQQNGCQDRGTYDLRVPCGNPEDFENTTIPEVVNHKEMGVSFAAWLARDPNAPLQDEDVGCRDGWAIGLWWGRNFYPNIEMVANDLHAKGLLEAGDYVINIDW